MATFPLLIGTPDGVLFDGKVERVMCRSITGDLAILAGHANYCTALGMGEAYVVLEDGTKKTAACIGGMLSVMNGECHLLATTWEWADDIDKDRAETAREKAEERLKNEKLSARDQRIVEAKLRRSLVRLGVKG